MHWGGVLHLVLIWVRETLVQVASIDGRDEEHAQHKCLAGVVSSKIQGRMYASVRIVINGLTLLVYRRPSLEVLNVYIGFSSRPRQVTFFPVFPENPVPDKKLLTSTFIFSDCLFASLVAVAIGVTITLCSG